MERGYYVYVGSGGKNVFKRVERHERREKKKFWHIDFLMENARIVYTVFAKVPEVWLAEKLVGAPVEGFGCSDSPLKSHLFKYPCEKTALVDVLKTLRCFFYLWSK